MRIIKFRAWYGKSIGMLIPEFNGNINQIFSQGEGEYMQFTGLHDCNGKEIYEGDIVTATSEGIEGTFEVKWRQGGSPSFILYPAWQHALTWSLHGTKGRDGLYYDNVEVIGNVYQNPDLINV